jgi:acetylornithine deacetylase/succinyl-diaminopimelate desuccinylase-like protein
LLSQLSASSAIRYISRNTVPDRCIFQISKRWLPGDSPEAVRRELEKADNAEELLKQKIKEYREAENLVPNTVTDTNTKDALAGKLLKKNCIRK